MKEPQFDALDNIFREVQRDLPPRLEAQLRAVPHRASAVTFWEPWMLPAVGIFIGGLWWALRHASALYEQALAPFRGIALPEFTITLPHYDWTLSILAQTDPMIMVGGAAAAVLAMGLGSWLFLQAETRADGEYIRHLNQHL